ncbi:hypothetical protein CK203_007073 [Vitis vinifera]|uniref:Uncharacterized protein n=1 Tax=Vitis vinifera TaxID=29760 RepID=A0A438KCA9_VITVI|nr:hypothetical protein CK203_007073 [Vitis vinifera]
MAEAVVSAGECENAHLEMDILCLKSCRRKPREDTANKCIAAAIMRTISLTFDRHSAKTGLKNDHGMLAMDPALYAH